MSKNYAVSIPDDILSISRYINKHKHKTIPPENITAVYNFVKGITSKEFRPAERFSVKAGASGDVWWVCDSTTYNAWKFNLDEGGEAAANQLCMMLKTMYVEAGQPS